MENIRYVGGHPFVRYQPENISEEESIARSQKFYTWLDQRRTVRDFSARPVPRVVIENILKAASTAPSGAHKQPWTFCVVTEPRVKQEIRIAAEKEEFESYNGRMSGEWLEDLKPLHTDWKKPFLEIAPCLIVVFKRAYDLQPSGEKRSNYYVAESTGIATGFLLAAVHNAGLVALTHTPSPMSFLSKILNRPVNERPFLLIPVGYPAGETYVPQLTRKGLDQVAVF